MTGARVLVCDDEPAMRRMVAEYLGERGLEVIEARNPTALRGVLERQQIDVVILDVRMPGEDGLTALRTLRGTSDVPVLMLTAVADTIDRVVGLELGADDYLGKPVDLRELEARVKALLRRRAGRPVAGHTAAAPSAPVAFGRCRLDLDGARLIGPAGTEVPITAMEFALLKVFAENPGRVLSRDRLLDLSHHGGWEAFDRSIDLRISRLRRKIEANPKAPETIRTVRGIGYIFNSG